MPGSADSGRYLLDGVDVSTFDDERASDFRNRRIGFVFQSFHLLPRLNVLENTLLPRRFLRGPDEGLEQRAHELLARTGLQSHLARRLGQLSGGQMQRVAIARALLLTGVLDQRHAGENDYRLVVPQQLYRQNQKTQRIFSVVMGSIAGVSLLVGGIGIMNIMLANVLERRREIGLLRAIGARRQDIVARFLREALVICASGALIGLLFGASLACIIAAFAGWQSLGPPWV